MCPMNKCCLALAVLTVFQAGGVKCAAIPPSGERLQSLQLAAHSELGILEYCRGRGFVDDAAVAAQRHFVESLPRAPDASTVGVLEEQAGRDGSLAFDGFQGRFEESAQAQGLTMKTACENRALVAKAITIP